MQNEEDDLVAPDIFQDLDGKEKSVEDLFLDADSNSLMAGLKESNLKAEWISPEDLAWVDSCLVFDPELSMENWASLKEALLNGITNLADSYAGNNAVGINEDDAAAEGEQMEVDEEEAVGKPPEIANCEGDAAAHVNDGEEEVQKVMELKESIFQVWDIRGEQEEERKEDELIPELQRAFAELRESEEEDDDRLLIELKQAVAESNLRDKQSYSQEEDEKLNEIISSMGNLSLNSSSKRSFF